MVDKQNIFIINGNNSPIANELLKNTFNKSRDNIIYLNEKSKIEQFNNGETRVLIVPDKNIPFEQIDKIIIIQSLTQDYNLKKSINDVIFETKLMINACRERNKNAKIILIAPNLGYARQDRAINKPIEVNGIEFETSEPETLKMVMKELKICGADTLITFDAHSAKTKRYTESIELGFKSIEMKKYDKFLHKIFANIFLENIKKSMNSAKPKNDPSLFFELLEQKEVNNNSANGDDESMDSIVDFFAEKLVFVAPDLGSKPKIDEIWEEIKTKLYAILEIYQKYTLIEKLKNHKKEIVYIEKTRSEPGQSSVLSVVGADNIDGKPCIIFDDILDTGGTLCNAVDELKKHNASDVYCFMTHGILSSNAIEKITKSQLKQVYITNTEPFVENKIKSYFAENTSQINKFIVFNVDTIITEILDLLFVERKR